MSRWIGLGLLLLAPWCLSGCLWITGSTAAILESSSDGSSGAPAPAGLSVALVPPSQAAVADDSCGAQAAAVDPGWREGIVHFAVTLDGTRSGTFPVALFYRDAQGLTPIEAVRPTTEGGSGAALHRHSLESPGTYRLAWNSSATIGEAKRLWIEARSRGARASTADSFWVDNRLPGSVEIGASTVSGVVQHDTVSIPLTLDGAEDVAVRLHVVGDDAGNARVEQLERGTSFELEGSTLRWDSHADLPNDHALVHLEVAPSNGTKTGGFMPMTDCFYVDNRAPRISRVQPLRVPNDSPFSLQVIGSGLRWPGSPGTTTRLSLQALDPQQNAAPPSFWIEPSSSSPIHPETDLAERALRCPCSRDLQQDLLGPDLLDFAIGPAELQEFRLTGYAGKVTVYIRNPNGRETKLENGLSLGPSKLSPVGPYCLLDGTPRRLVLGDFALDLPASGAGGAIPGVTRPRHLDAAVIFEDRNVVAILGGEGNGFFPDRWVATLTSDARPLAIATVPSAVGGCDALLVATENTLELIRCKPGTRGSFLPAQVVAGELEHEPENRDLVLADFNGDGVDDAAVSSRARSKVQVFLGSGDPNGGAWVEEGSFELPVSLPRSIAAANIDADPEGLADVVVLGEREGVDTLFFHRNQVPDLEAWRTSDATLEVSDGAVSVLTRADARFNDDEYLDLVVAREGGSVSRVLTTRDANGQWDLRRFPRPSGPVMTSPASAALLRLPAGAQRGGVGLLDLVAVDHEFLVCTYATTHAVNAGESSQYRLPGPGVAIAAGDINGDGVDDVAVVTAGPPAFQVFLGRTTWEPLRVECDVLLAQKEPSPERNACAEALAALQTAPLVRPAGRLDGENAADLPRGEDLKTGRQGGATFIATANRLTEEVIVAFLKPDTVIVDRVARFRGFGDDLRAIAVGDFDGDGDDEIAVTARKQARITLLDPENGSRKVVLDLFDLHSRQPDQFPAALLDVVDRDPEESPKQLRGLIKMTTAQLNDQGPPEIILGLITEATSGGLNRDYVVVVVDPGSGGQTVHFYRTLDDPRQCTVANINGDAALDLVVACEGDGTPQGGGAAEPFGNSVHILFGDPRRTGGHLFFDEDSPPGGRPPGWIAPLQLPAYPDTDSGGETEFVLTDSRLEDGYPRASFILASNSPNVIAYLLCHNGRCPGGSESFCSQLPGYPRTHVVGQDETIFIPSPFCVLTGGGDPEDLLLADFFPETEGLDLVVADEDNGTVELFIKDPSVVVGWKHRAALPVSRPYGIAAIPTRERLALGVGSASRRELVFYEQACSQGQQCSYTPTESQLLVDPAVKGSLPGFSTARAAGRDFLVASLVEDRDLVTRNRAVDVTLVPANLDRAALAYLGDPGGAAPSVRIELGEADDPAPDGVLLVDGTSSAAGEADGFPDLLVHDQGGAISRVPLAVPKDAGAAPQVGEAVPLGNLTLSGRLLDWEVIPPAEGGPILLAASTSEVRAVDLRPEAAGARVDVRLPASPTLRQLAHGWREFGPTNVKRPFLILLEDRDLQVAWLAGDGAVAPVSLLEGQGEAQDVLLRAVVATDLDGDDRDDVVAVDALNSSLLVFLAVHSAEFAFQPARAFPYTGQLEPAALVSLDANGDTVRDVAFGALDGTVLLFAGEGDGTFDGAEQLFAGPELENLSAFDLDGDGKDEILAAVGVPGLVVISFAARASADIEGDAR